MPIYQTKNGKACSLEIADLRCSEAVQVRDSGTDPTYAEDLAELAKNGAKLPRIKVMRVEDDNAKGDFVFDGLHTLEAHKINNKKKIAALLFNGTYAELLQAAAQSNREHDKSGRKLTRADKHRAVQFFGEAFKNTPIGKRPTNIETAKALNVSEAFVSLCDPFGRRKPKEDGPSGASDESATPSGGNESSDEDERELTLTPSDAGKNDKPTEKVIAGFGWHGFASDIARVVGGFAALAIAYPKIKGTTEYTLARQQLDAFIGQAEEWQTKYGKGK